MIGSRSPARFAEFADLALMLSAQAMATAKVYMWKRFKRLVAIGTLVDWITRWIRM